ncbi:MAG: phosphatase PAP2 family protein [Candidatus Obscuribacterales bacterium]|nr:phosphatase PAP2 family protein [Steroidobacteraceae bacterium]
MATVGSTELFRRFDAAEQRLCISFNRWSDRNALRVFFATVSRLGNGVFWYVLILSLPVVSGIEGGLRALQFTLTGTIGVLLYKWMKQRWVRERPYISHLSIRAGTAPLDRYSFPSGHTLHAVCFAVLFAVYFPVLSWIVIPFAALVAVSRVVLGLHYPTDVAMGALLGASLAISSVYLLA